MGAGMGVNIMEMDVGMIEEVVGGLDIEDEAGDWGDDAEDGGDGSGHGDDDELEKMEEPDENDGWDTGDGDELDIAMPAGADDGYYVPPSPGESAGEKWAKSSQLASEHVAVGSFESAMALLRDQVITPAQCIGLVDCTSSARPH